MAATVEGIFRIIDRASGPMKRMEDQAKRTDRAIKNLGMTTDAVGTSQQQRNIEGTTKAVQNFGTETDRTTPRVKKLNRELNEQDKLWVRLRNSLGRVGAAIAGVGRIMRLLIMPGIAAGIGILVQAVGALAGGVVALLPRLGDLGGAALALGPVIAGMGLAMVTTKLAFNDFGKALGGNKNALKSLTPDARKFLTTLKEYAPVMKELRTSAQSGLFGGLDFALRRLMRGLPVVNTLLREMSQRLGSLAGAAAARVTTPGFLQDILGIGQAGGRAVSRGGAALLNIASALRHLTAAAIPFTDWITKGVVALSKWIERWTIFQRDSGNIERFLDRTKDSMRLFANILKNVWTWMGNLLRAARPLGERLWRDAERATRSWAKLTGSLGGQLSLRRQFNAMYDTIHEVVGLVEDLVRAVFRMGSEPGAERLARALRDMVPQLEALLNLFAEAFGPPLIRMIEQLVRLLESLSGATGPIALMLSLMADVLSVINELIDRIPHLGRVLTSALSVLAIGLFIGKVRALAGSWWMVVTGAKAAAAAEQQAMIYARGMQIAGVGAAAGAGAGAAAAGTAAAGAGGVAAGAARWVKDPATGAMVPNASRFAEAGSEAAAAARGGGRLASRFPGMAARGAAVGARLGAFGTAAGGAARAAGKFALPVMGIMAAYDAYRTRTDPTLGYEQQGAQRLQGAVSKATFGLVSAPQTRYQGRQTAAEKYFTAGAGGFKTGGGIELGAFGAPIVSAVAERSLRPFIRKPGQRETVQHESMAQRLTQGLAPFGGESPKTIRDLAGSVRVYQQEIKRSIPFLKDAGQAGKDALTTAREELRLRRELLRVKQQERDATGRAQGYKFIRQLGQAHNIYADKFGEVGATERTNKEVVQRMKAALPAERRVISQRYTQWLYFEQKRNPALRKVYVEMLGDVRRAYRQMGVHIAVRQGQIYEGTRKSWQNIVRTMGTQMEKAKQITSDGFTDMQKQAQAVLQAMGFSGAKATSLIQATERGGKAGAAAAQAVDMQAAGQAGPVINEGTITGGKATRARGGRIPGTGLHDHVAVGGAMAAPGELIVNRHTEARVNRMLGGRTTLGSEVDGEQRPHYMAKGGRLGGGISDIVAGVLERFPLQVTSTTGGKHAEGSLHYQGMAADLGGSAAAMNQAAGWIMASGTFHKLLEGIHNPNLSVKNGQVVPASFWGAQTWAGHADHLHLASSGSTAGMGAATGVPGGGAAPMPISAAQLYRPSGMPGLIGAASNAAQMTVAAGMAAKLNALTGATGGPATAGGGGGSAQAIGRRMMLAMGWGLDQWPALQQLWQGESGWSASAHNASSGAHGIPQALPGSKMASAGADWATNPATQIRWGLGYIKDRYGSPSSALQAWQGRSPHWYGDGGDFIARRPQVIGVGDKGPERVTVTPVGRGRSGVSGVTVHIERIENHREGDVVKAIHREMALLARDLEQGVLGSGDDGVLA